MKGFISYAHDDVAMLERFRSHLVALDLAFGVAFWSDDSLRAGHHWNQAIQDAINEAHVFLLLVSPSFIASDYIRRHERPAIDARCKAVNGLILPVILMPCDWQPVVNPLQAAPVQGVRLLPVTQWDRDDHAYDAARMQIHAAIRDHFRVIDRRNPDTDALVGMQPERPGPVVIERMERLDLDLAGDEGDIAATRNAITRQLHTPNRRKAEELVEMLARAGNRLDPSWDRFVVAARDLAGALDRSIEDIPANLGTVWEASVRCASFLLRDKRLREAGSRDPEPLPDDIHELFDDLVGSVAPWVRRFPTARDLDDDRGSFLTRRDLFEPAARVIQHAVQADLLTPAAGHVLCGSVETARGDDPVQAAKAGTFAMKGARGLVTRAASYTAGFLAGAMASGYANESPLMRRIGRFLAGAESDAVALVADLPGDLRHGVGRIFARAERSDFPGKPNVPATSSAVTEADSLRDLERPPEDFVDQAKIMILQGKIPPSEWWPFITELDFAWEPAAASLASLRPIAPLTALRSLRLAGTQVVDLSPLTALASLEVLDLEDTPVNDVSALKALKSLQELELRDSAVIDLRPLGILSGLRRLSLRNTRISDLSGLEGLTSLRFLDMALTRVEDLTFLKGLRCVETLIASYTPANNMSVIGELSSLEYLNISDTPLSDVAFLDSLGALQSLDLGRTRIRSIRSLERLAFLRSLNLSATGVSDMNSVEALTALQFLNLSHSDVRDIAPLASLTALQSLNLTATRVLSLLPLASLPYLRELVLTGARPVAAHMEILRRRGVKITGGPRPRKPRPTRPA
ncbi:MAG: leucine-rich repeat domain-containing protein [Acetobacteraceae bacterium]